MRTYLCFTVLTNSFGFLAWPVYQMASLFQDVSRYQSELYQSLAVNVVITVVFYSIHRILKATKMGFMEAFKKAV